MVVIKNPSTKRAGTRVFYRNVAGCALIHLALVYGLYSVLHIEQLSIDEADAAIRNIERQAEERIRKIGLPLPDYERIQDEMDQAKAYVQSFHSLDRSLKFFHIPKTAGTAIEDAAGAHHIPWGSCLFRHQPKRDICRYPKDSRNWPIHVGYWHVPRFLFPVCDVDPYQNAESFAVVREPYERMVSEFYYICTLKVFDWRPDQCHRDKLHDPEYMNEWLQQKIHENTNDGGRQSDSHPALAYLSDNGHFTPQYDFIVGPHEVRYVDFVLDLEHLSDGFAELMRAFGLEKLVLKKMNALGAKSRDEAQLTTKHLSSSTLDLIHQRFGNDFLFGYPKRRAKFNALQKEKSLGKVSDHRLLLEPERNVIESGPEKVGVASIKGVERKSGLEDSTGGHKMAADPGQTTKSVKDAVKKQLQRRKSKHE